MNYVYKYPYTPHGLVRSGPMGEVEPVEGTCKCLSYSSAMVIFGILLVGIMVAASSSTAYVFSQTRPR